MSDLALQHNEHTEISFHTANEEYVEVNHLPFNEVKYAVKGRIPISKQSKVKVYLNGYVDYNFLSKAHLDFCRCQCTVVGLEYHDLDVDPISGRTWVIIENSKDIDVDLLVDHILLYTYTHERQSKVGKK